MGTASMTRFTYYMAAFALLLIYLMSRSGEVLTTGEMFVSLIWFLAAIVLWKLVAYALRDRR